MKKVLLLTGLLPALACGGGRYDQPLRVRPEAPSVRVGDTLVLTAGDDEGGEVDWEVQEAYGGGLLQSHGPRITYVPPEAAGAYHLVLRTQAPGGHGHKQVVEIRVLPDPVLEPAAPHVPPAGSVQFRARMKGLARDAATWAVEEADGGEITQDGHYTAPRRPGVYHVIATATGDPTASARTPVTVGEP